MESHLVTHAHRRLGPPSATRRAAAILVLVVAALGATASGPPSATAQRPGVDAVSEPGAPSRPAVRVPIVSDAVSVSTSGPMSPAVVGTLEELGASLGVPTSRGRSFNIGLSTVRRGSLVVQQAAGPGPGVWQFPMSVTSLPVDAIGRVMGTQVSTVVAQGGVVLGATSAALRGAQAGDTLDLIAADGNARRFVLGLVAPDAEIGGAELVMSPQQADVLGATVTTRVLFFGSFDREALDRGLAARGMIDGGNVRISRSWAPANPDGLLSSAQTKLRLGEFDYRINSDGGLTLDADWVRANLVYTSFRDLNVRATCHRGIVADLQAALAEVAASGLASAIDLGNTNTYGGCYNPRFARVSGSLGSVSRHAWAMAIDMNTVTNAQGATPRMDCRVVRIFRKHGFAWGGNFLVPDGMHFEWVGEPRHTLPFASKYCPNLPGGAISVFGAPDPTAPSTPPATQRDTMFAEDLVPEAHG